MRGQEDDPGLAGKVAIVSGGGAKDDGIGNGRAAAILLARAGTRVVVSDIDKKLAERTVEMIVADGGTAVAEACDATREADCKRLVDAAVDRWGRLDFLDNNIGIRESRQVDDLRRIGKSNQLAHPLHRIAAGHGNQPQAVHARIQGARQRQSDRSQPGNRDGLRHGPVLASQSGATHRRAVTSHSLHPRQIIRRVHVDKQVRPIRRKCDVAHTNIFSKAPSLARARP